MKVFYYILDGEVEAIDPRSLGRYGEGTLGPAQFFGEIYFLSDGRMQLGARAVRDTKIHFVDRPVMHNLMARIPELSDIVITQSSLRGGGGSWKATERP